MHISDWRPNIQEHIDIETKFKPGDIVKSRNVFIIIIAIKVNAIGEILYRYIENGEYNEISVQYIDKKFKLVA